jgi:hypothetical protein
MKKHEISKDQFKLDFEDKNQIIKNKDTDFHSENEEAYINEVKQQINNNEVVNLSEDELKELIEELKTDPDRASEYYALIEKMTKIEELKYNQRMNEIDESIKQEKINELKKSIDKSFREDIGEDDFYDRDDSTGGYRHTAELARQKKEEEIKKREESKANKIKDKSKPKKRKFSKNWNSLKDIIKRDNLR